MPIYTVTPCPNCNIDHEWIFTMPTLQELWMISELPGINVRGGIDLLEGIAALEPGALTALMYILHKRDKITIPFKKINLDLDPGHFSMDLTEQEAAEQAKAEAEAKAKAEAEEDGEAEAAAVNPLPTSGPRRKAASSRK